MVKNNDDVFWPAIKEMILEEKTIYGPESFQDYLEKNKLPKVDTASKISIDSYNRLSPSLKEYGVMVLRLGKSQGGTTTQFILIKTDIDSFFIKDEMPDSQPVYEKFNPYSYVEEGDLLAFKVFPNFSETYFVSLGLASGLFSYALNLEPGRPIANPARGNSSFTFQLRIHSSIDQIYNHDIGQVEIDLLFVGKRKGRQVLFVVEAKKNNNSLAKHKLVYPIMSIGNKVPSDIEIVPVFVNINKKQDTFNYNIVECKLPDVRTNIVAIDELKPVKYTHLSCPSFIDEYQGQKL